MCIFLNLCCFAYTSAILCFFFFAQGIPHSFSLCRVWAVDRTGGGVDPWQGHGVVPVYAREGCVWKILQATSGSQAPKQQECLRRLWEEHDLQAQGKRDASVTEEPKVHIRCSARSLPSPFTRPDSTSAVLTRCCVFVLCRRNVAVSSPQNWKGCSETWAYPTPPWMSSGNTYKPRR